MEYIEIKTRYQILRDKAEKCRLTARRACSIWALDYWNKVAAQLEEMAGNLPVVRCQNEKILNDIELIR